MRGNHDQDFNKSFAAITSGRIPFCWQVRLYRHLVKGNVPGICTLPTGLGKTSVIPIWLIALANSAGNQSILPRRLVYIVNRRTVVDQATDDAKLMLGRILRSGQRDGLSWATEEALAELGLSNEPQVSDEHAPAMATLRDALAQVCGDNVTAPLAVSALRGELADNGEWKRSPARPAIIIGTIDMIGSKLLFSGYGDGRYGRAHHAGLIGQDTLIVHDESHLSPAFSVLLRSVEDEQKACQELRPIRVMELSATSRGKSGSNGGNGQAFGIEKEDEKDQLVQDRLNAVKKLTIEVAEQGKLVEMIVAKATLMGQRPCRVLVYVRSPKTAGEVAEVIKKKLGAGAGDRIGLLTGTIRGFERDELARSPLFIEFHSNPTRAPLSHALYLVSTSAGEVGADLDADHLVCDLSTLDSMAQRFGRVNRLGGKDQNGSQRTGAITVVVEKPKESKKGTSAGKAISALDNAIAKTDEILRAIQENGGDVSPASLKPVLEAEQNKCALSPTPTILPATDILFDSWALSSITGDLPGRPEVGPYLHGVAEWEPPETEVAWRAEIGELAQAEVRVDEFAEILEAFPILAAERLRDTAGRVLDELIAIASRHPEANAILVKNGEPRLVALPELAPADKAKKDEAQRLLAYTTVVLPTEVGGLNGGMLNGESVTTVDDVAEAQAHGQRNRQRVWVRNEDAPKGVLSGELIGGLLPKHRQPLGQRDPEEEDSGPTVTIEYRVARAESGEPGTRVELVPHNDAASQEANRIGMALGLPSELCAALGIAGQWHDSGKARPLWQKYAKNYGYNGQPNSAAALAKSPCFGHWKTLNGYRHEFGSLLDAVAADQVINHPESDLILHMIASHHGWGRPHFKHDARSGAEWEWDGASAYDFEGPLDEATGERCPRTLEENQAAAAEAMRRYAALQRRFGRWGLAWLESLLRCADAIATEGGKA